MSIQQQSLKLELGEVFDEFWARTESYVKGLIGKPWWHSTKQLLQNEGPLSRMTEHCLIYVVEQEDRIEGYKAYTNYLTSEYGTSQSHNTNHYNIALAEKTVASTLLGADTYSEPKVSRNIDWLKEEDKDFMYVMQAVSVLETAAMMDMSIDEVWAKYRLIKRKAARRKAKT